MRRRRLEKALGIGVLATAFLVASSVPFVHEALWPGHAAICGINHGVASLVSQTEAAQAILTKICLVFVALVIGVSVVVGGFRSPSWSRLASYSPLQAGLFVAAVMAIGLSAFDCCTAFHGATTDVSGTCHCWLTGLLAMLSAIFVAVGVHSVRDLTRWMWHWLHTTVIAGLWIVRVVATPFLQRNAAIIPTRLQLADILHIVGERAPPSCGLRAVSRVALSV